MKRLVLSMLAGWGATSVHLLLMSLKKWAGLLPAFEPYDDLQRVLNAATAGAVHPPGWVLAYVNGALVLGFVFGKAFPYLPKGSPLRRGAAFGIFAWLAMGLGLLPVSGRGVFAVHLGLGAWPALLMLAMLTVYAVSMSWLYEWLVGALARPQETCAQARSWSR